MQRRLTISLILAAVLGAAFELVSSAAAQDVRECTQRYTTPDDQRDIEWRFVRESLLFNECTGYAGRIIRWTKPISVELLSAKEDVVRPVVQDIIGALNRALQGTGVSLSLHGQGGQGDIVMMTNDMPSILEVMKNNGHDVPMAPGDAYTVLYSNHAHEGVAAAIFIMDDARRQDVEAAIAQELFQALGPDNDTPYFTESVTYESGEVTSTATRPSWIDLKLLRFVYRHLSPGDNECDLKQAYDRYWQSLEMP